MFLILAAVIAAGVAVVRLTRHMDTSQRVVAVVVFLLALVYVFRKAMELGILGRRMN